MVQRPARRPARPLDEAGLRALALSYVGRYATTRARLRSYLARKLRERGWAGEGDLDLDGVVARMAELHYVDDEAFASARAGALQRRGFGPMRVRAALRSAGIDAETSTALSDVPQEDAFAAARALAERRGFGSDPDRRERQMAALVRAGHSFAAARAALDGIASETNLAPH